MSAHELDLLVIAGGYGPDKLRTDDGVLRLVRDMHEGARLRSSPRRLGAGVRWIVEGRRVTSVAAIADDLRNAGAEWEDSRSWWTAT